MMASMRICFAAAFLGLALTACGGKAMSGNEMVLAEVRALNDEINDAALAGDADFLAAHLADGFVASDPSNSVRRRDDLIALFSGGKVSYESYQSQIDFAEEVAPGLVVIMGMETTTQSMTPEETSADLVRRRITRRFTNVFRHEQDSWKLLVKQSTIIRVE